MIDQCWYEDGRGKRCDRRARKHSLFCDIHDPQGGGGWAQVVFGLTKASTVAASLVGLVDIIKRLLEILGPHMHDTELPAMKALADMQRRGEAVLLFVESLPAEEKDAPDLADAIQHLETLKAELAAWDRKNSAAFLDRDLVTAEDND
jgi:hypothetical protein